MLHVSLTHCVRIISILLVVTIILATSLFVWVITGPRSVNFLNPYVEKALANITHSFDVSIDDTMLVWNEWNYTIDLQVTNVHITQHTGENNTPHTIAHFPAIALDFSLASLLRGELQASHIEIIQPEIHFSNLAQTEAAPHRKNNLTLSALTHYLQQRLTQYSDALLPINSLTIRNASMYLEGTHEPVLWHISEMIIDTTEDAHGNHMILADITIAFEEKESRLSFRIYLTEDSPQNETVRFDIHAENFHTHSISKAISYYANTTPNEGIDLTLNGYLHVDVDIRGKLHHADITIDKATGTITLPTLFPEPLPIDSLTLRTQIAEQGKTLVLEHFLGKFSGSTLEASGNISFEQDGWQIDADATATHMPVSELYRFWPLPLGSKVRHWVTTHIYGGTVPKATAHFSLNSQDIKDKALPSTAIDATITVEDTNVNYLDATLPPALGVSATVHFSGTAMNATIHRGMAQDAIITQGEVIIPSFYSNPAHIHVDGNITSSVEDLLPFARAFAQTELPAITGNAATHLVLDVPLRESITKDDFAITITSKVTECAIPDIIGDIALQQGKIEARFDGNILSTEGNAYLDSLPITLKSTHHLFNSDPHLYTIATNIPASYLDRFGVTTLPFMTGITALYMDIKHQPNKQLDIYAGLDFTHNTIHLETYGLHKANNIPATALITATIHEDRSITIHPAEIQSANLSITGAATLDSNQQLRQLDIHRFYDPNNDFSARYIRDGFTRSFTLQGSKLDLSSVDLDALFDNSSATDNMATTINIALDNVTMKHQQRISQLNARYDNRNTDYSLIALKATLSEDATVSITTNPENTAHILLHTNDAGRLIAAMNLSDKIKGGILDLAIERNADNTQAGILTMQKFHVIGAPILAKLLTITSFPGIASNLTGEGIPFTKLTAPFTYKNNKIILGESQSYGQSLGITAKGHIHMDTKEAHIQGTVIPGVILSAYFVHKVVDNIPLIGELLPGGKKGVFATSYSLTGSLKDPEIKANPLSMLTPGILKDVFTSFTPPEEETEETPAKPSEPEAETITPPLIDSNAP